MTVTETPPEAAQLSTGTEAALGAPTADVGGLAAIIGSGDHKVLGRLYIGFSLLFGLVALAAGLLVSVDRIDGTFGNTILTADSWNQVWTFQSTAIVFLFLVPLLLGVAFTVVPLQVGSDTIAFPRAAAASFWGWLMGSGAFIAAYAINGGPGGGEAKGVGLWAVAFAMLLGALLLGAVCVVTTVFTLRAEGMTLDRTPMFAWSMLAAGVMWILTIPVLIGVLALIYVDHRYGQKSFGFNGPQMFGRISWSLRQPQVYAFATPILGLAADVVPVAARARQGARTVTMGAIGLFSVLGFGAFLQTTIYPRATVQPVIIVMAVLAILPVLVSLGGWAATLKGGKPKVISPLVFALAAVLSLLLATVLGAALSIQRFDLQGTLFELGHSNLTIFATVTAALGALYYWATKVNGRPLVPGLGLLTAVVLLLGTLLASVPYAVSGAFGDGKDATSGIEALNAAAAAGYALVLLGLLLTVVALLGGLKGDGEAAADPWEGHTLEWTTASPPATQNFPTVPVVHSAEPLLDEDVATGQEAEA